MSIHSPWRVDLSSVPFAPDSAGGIDCAFARVQNNASVSAKATMSGLREVMWRILLGATKNGQRKSPRIAIRGLSGLTHDSSVDRCARLLAPAQQTERADAEQRQRAGFGHRDGDDRLHRGPAADRRKVHVEVHQPVVAEV